MTDVSHQNADPATVVPGNASAGPDDGVRLTPAQERARNRRSLALGLALAALAVLFFVVTLVRLGANVANRTPVGL